MSSHHPFRRPVRDPSGFFSLGSRIARHRPSDAVPDIAALPDSPLSGQALAAAQARAELEALFSAPRTSQRQSVEPASSSACKSPHVLVTDVPSPVDGSPVHVVVKRRRHLDLHAASEHADPGEQAQSTVTAQAQDRSRAASQSPAAAMVFGVRDAIHRQAPMALMDLQSGLRPHEPRVHILQRSTDEAASAASVASKSTVESAAGSATTNAGGLTPGRSNVSDQGVASTVLAGSESLLTPEELAVAQRRSRNSLKRPGEVRIIVPEDAHSPQPRDDQEDQDAPGVMPRGAPTLFVESAVQSQESTQSHHRPRWQELLEFDRPAGSYAEVLQALEETKRLVQRHQMALQDALSIG